MNTSRYSIKLTSVEMFDPIILAVPRCYARVAHTYPSDFVDRLLEKRGEESKVFFLTDGKGHKEMLLINMKDNDQGWLS